ncbi:hypothetical protein E8E12_005040 [Didymella heteroderae]|uniref:Protein kinase domain-containing protein n=1 Tax=Didymella heteroderae TaxID=1769908 RepID=A0A9P4X050_9PLEO|nr:hypothetical protein E8E12_005040 [Didymella heteroderae]
MEEHEEGQAFPDYRAALPNDYVYVSEGPDRHILYCLPRDSIPTHINRAALRSDLVVVKVRRRPYIQAEIDILIAIRNSAVPDANIARTHFLKLLDVTLPEDSEDSLSGLVMPAVLPAVTLGDWALYPQTDDPTPFIYYVFLSLTTALRFLHSHIRIEHGDLHDGNVMLRRSVSDPSGLSELVLIDFENKREVNGETSRDYYDLLFILSNLIEQAERSVDDDWPSFKASVRNMLYEKEAKMTRRVRIDVFDDFCEQWKGVAEEDRGQVSDRELAVTLEMFESAVEKREQDFVEPLSIMASVPDKYEIVSEAGRGAHSRIYFSLLRASIAFVKVQNKITKDSIGFAGLKKSLVAIEVSPNRALIYREYGVLQAIQRSTAAGALEARRHYLAVKDTGDFRTVRQ